jgi:hypothetical protein
MLTSLTLVSLVPGALIQEPAVTLDILGERLEVAGQKIAKSLGLEAVIINPQIKDQVVLISVKNVPQKEFLAQLDQTLNIEFSKKSEGWWLTQSPIQKVREEKAEKAARDGQLKELIAELKKAIDAQPTFDANEVKDVVKKRQSAEEQMRQSAQNQQRPNEQSINTLRQLSTRNPQSRFAYRLAARIRPEHLNALTDSQTRIVFSTKPTSMQKPFPFAVADLLNQLRVEQQTWVDNGGAQGGGRPGGRGGNGGGPGGGPGGQGGGRGGRGGGQGNGGGFEDVYASAEPIQGAGPGRDIGGAIEFRIPGQGGRGGPGGGIRLGGQGGPGGPGGPGGMFGGMFGGNTPYTATSLDTVTMAVELKPSPSIQIRVYSADDNTTLQSQINLNMLKPDSFTAFQTPATTGSKLAPELAEFPNRYQQARFQSVLNATPSAGLVTALLAPESNDPLSISAAKQIRMLAGTRNVMMVLDDSLLAGQSFALDNMASFGAKKPNAISDLAVTDQWLTRSWVNPLDIRPQQIDRTKLGNLTRFMNKNKRPLTIEEEATFVAQLPWEYDTWRGYNSMAVTAGLTTNQSLFQSTPAYRIYGNLSATDRTNAKTATGMDIGKLSGGAQKELYRAIFLTEANQFRLDMGTNMMQFGGAPGANGRPGATIDPQQLVNQMRRMFTGKMTEPTFALPNGLQPGMMLKLSETSSIQLATPPDPKATENFRMPSMDPRGYGMAVYAQKNAQTNQRGPFRMGEGIDPNRIVITNQRSVRISLVVNKEGMSRSWNLQSSAPQTSKIYTMDSLPADIKKQVDEGYKMAGQMADRLQNMPRPNNNGGGGRRQGGGTPPPLR